MHQLRHRVFKKRLDWDVHISGDMEIDDFDALHPTYLTQVADDGRIQGSVRLLPSVGPTMLRDTFPALLAGQTAPSSPSIWECSRFAVDVPTDAPKGEHGIARATYELLAGVIEFGLSRRLTDIVTVTDARMERVLRRAVDFGPRGQALQTRKYVGSRRLSRNFDPDIGNDSQRRRYLRTRPLDAGDVDGSLRRRPNEALAKTTSPAPRGDAHICDQLRASNMAKIGSTDDKRRVAQHSDLVATVLGNEASRHAII